MSLRVSPRTPPDRSAAVHFCCSITPTDYGLDGVREMRTSFILAALVFSGASFAHADSIDDRQTFQYGQIERGRQDGSITWTEGLRLRAEQRRISQMKADLAIDGRVPKVNRPVLYRMQDEAALHIDRALEGGPHRMPGLPRVGQ